MQKDKPIFVSVKKVISIINSCETNEQLKTSLRLIDNYVEILKRKGLSNTEIVKKRLMKEFNQKKFQLNMIRLFVKRDNKQFERVPVRMMA
jgi:hypothetical protein